MNRTTITMNEYGWVVVQSDTASVWMSEMELVELFDVIAPTLRAAMLAVYKSRVLTPFEVGRTHQVAQRLLCGCVRLANGRGTCFPN